MSLRNRRSNYQQFIELIEFERGRIMGRRGGSGVFFSAIILGRNVSTVMILGSSGQGMVLPQEYRVPGSHMTLLRGKTDVFGGCQVRSRWRSAVCFFCLDTSDGRVLVRRRPGKRLHSNCLRPRHTGPAIGVMVWGEISYDSKSNLVVTPNTPTVNLYVSLVIQSIILPFMSTIQGGVFQQDNAYPHTAVATQRNVDKSASLQSVDMLPWPARSPDLSPIEHAWYIMGQLQHHQPASTDLPNFDTTSMELAK
ncbi:transposable element Tc1 transposase [Trichonephila clavipes]|uniref:Transposable element Tc1 transposase n=1 Tax=Trichonephila clavipes TaxID=2585209 RepID=A0A8X6VMC7_TRICX|nr:transposable element Tc1 transposase [Trichonephila clavipes]